MAKSKRKTRNQPAGEKTWLPRVSKPEIKPRQKGSWGIDSEKYAAARQKK